MSSLAKVGRNDPCPCGSGAKYKKCCLHKDEANNVIRLGTQSLFAEENEVEEYEEVIPQSYEERVEFIELQVWASEQYRTIALQLNDHLRERYEPLEIITIITLWMTYSRDYSPIINKPDVIFATMEYVMGILTGNSSITQTSVAKQYSVSSASVSNRFKDMTPSLDQLLNLMLLDEEDEEDDDDFENVHHFARNELESQMRHFRPDFAKASPAQKLIDQANQTTSAKMKKKLAEQALALDPLHPDAYNLIAEELEDIDEAAKLYKRGIDAGRKQLGTTFFTENKGYFWGLLETRPFMRAMHGYGEICLFYLHQYKEGVHIFEEMLDLCPNDNMGIRYLLVTGYILLKQYPKALALINHYDESCANFNYNRLLISYLQHGVNPSMKPLFKQAIAQNPHVVPFILGSKKMPKHPPATIGSGDETEAIDYIMYHNPLYTASPKLVKWMSRS
ncbi:YecA family protein [Paenibacillus oryzisoli]|uniref:HTH psq-type domain-containing protein n=1 Tax=Paenibacillus oryzisoli TaxID=1850517 RepID=A0A198AF86_9BACL|nr:SEC-C metal-binding domain-containing protein [Paenibacillus oryzisoli]OAS19701.1 hypothetical protein A8708_26115 [Paenibacillus oryzisoli]